MRQCVRRLLTKFKTLANLTRVDWILVTSMTKKCTTRFKFWPWSIVFRKKGGNEFQKNPCLEVNFVLCLHKPRGDAPKTHDYCMNVCTNKIPLKRYQIFQKYKYLINFDLKRQSAYSVVTSAILLAREVQARKSFQVSSRLYHQSIELKLVPG